MIIKSILDTDLYKITMGQAIFMHYPKIDVTYHFVNRGKTIFPTGFKEKLLKEIKDLSKLKLTSGEKLFLESIPYLKRTYIDWFANFQFNPKQVFLEQQNGELICEIKGPWYQTVYWEVPLMAIISELYFKKTNQKANGRYITRITEWKGKMFKDRQIKVADFGTRRRFSFEVQKKVLNLLIRTAGKAKDGGFLNGTSNVYLAMKLGLTPIGTFAHEWIQAHSAIWGYERATTEALRVWDEEFEAVLGIALSDTYTTDEFLTHFSNHYAKLFDGVRQDSGNPVMIMEKIIKHYQDLGINPKSKTFVASDNLNVVKVIAIQDACRGRIQCSFGIGTNLTNDVDKKIKPLNMVIKLWDVTLPDGRIKKVVKLSDDSGKITGDSKEAEIARYVLFGKN